MLVFLLSIPFIVVVSVRKSSSSSRCLGKAVLFHRGTSWTFHLTILLWWGVEDRCFLRFFVSLQVSFAVAVSRLCVFFKSIV